MWWNAVDLSTLPRTPCPQHIPRKPKWHSMAIDMVPMLGGLEEPRECTVGGKTLGGSCWPGNQPGLSRSTGTTLARNQISPLGGQGERRRPKSAPSATVSLRRPNSAALGIITHAKSRRPQSAPRLLRGDGLILKRPGDIQEDKTLQRMEEYSVNFNLETFKREKHLFKDKVDGVEMLEDPILYDLKVLHNGRQRAQSLRLKEARNELEKEMQEFKKTPPAANDLIRRQRLDEVKRRLQSHYGSEAVRELCVKLDANLRKHAKRLDFRRVSQATLQEKGAKLRDVEILLQFTEDEEQSKAKGKHEFMHASISGLFRSVKEATLKPPSFLGDEDDRSECPSDMQAIVQPAPEPSSVPLLQPPALTSNGSGSSKPKGSTHYGSRTSSLTDAVAITLAELVGFLIGCCGTVETAFRALDSDCDGRINAHEWESGLHRLGFKDEVACVFRLLGKAPEEGATLNELQALFSPCLETLRCMPRRQSNAG
mmetsp:Transcript_11734/g.18594  ORF Transcript_11734/g.18594 Transcript_11734/m.18594 type:complete len:483 (-) Transcript_11734:37-1485(-)